MPWINSNIVLLLIGAQIGYAQPGPLPVIKIRTNNFPEIKTIQDNFEITAIYYESEDTIQNPVIEISEFDRKLSIRQNNGIYEISIGLFHYKGNWAIPHSGAVLALTVKNKNAPQQSMIIYIRISFTLGFGDEIVFIRPTFKIGAFFYDMCTSIEKYEFRSSVSNPMVDLIDLEFHEIVNDELIKILEKYKCY